MGIDLRTLLIAVTVVVGVAGAENVVIKTVPEDRKLEFSPDAEGTKKLSCRVDPEPKQPTSKIIWTKINIHDRKEETVTEGIEGATNGDLTLQVSSLKPYHTYRCKYNEEAFADFELIDVTAPRSGSKIFRVEKLPRSLSVIESDDLKLNCVVVNKTYEGFNISDIEIKWYMWKTVDDLSFEQSTFNCSDLDENWIPVPQSEGSEQEEPHYKFLSRDGFSKAILKIEDAVRSDRRGYKCIAVNTTADSDVEDCAETSTFVRVKDKFAALWPFLGIVAEVIVLSVIILITERRRVSKESEEEEEEDGVIGNSANSAHPEKPNVRHRK